MRDVKIQHGPVFIDDLGRLLYVTVDAVELVKVHELERGTERGEEPYHRCITVKARDGTIVTLMFGAEQPEQLVLTDGGPRQI